MGGGWARGSLALTSEHVDSPSLSLRVRWVFTLTSLRCHLDPCVAFCVLVPSVSLHSHFGVIYFSLRIHLAFTQIPVRFHFEITLISLRCHFGFTLISLGTHFDFTSISLRVHFVFTAVSL